MLTGIAPRYDPKDTPCGRASHPTHVIYDLWHCHRHFIHSSSCAFREGSGRRYRYNHAISGASLCGRIGLSDGASEKGRSGYGYAQTSQCNHGSNEPDYGRNGKDRISFGALVLMLQQDPFFVKSIRISHQHSSFQHMRSGDCW